MMMMMMMMLLQVVQSVMSRLCDEGVEMAFIDLICIATIHQDGLPCCDLCVNIVLLSYLFSHRKLLPRC
jgi:hypothetical protein